MKQDHGFKLRQWAYHSSDHSFLSFKRSVDVSNELNDHHWIELLFRLDKMSWKVFLNAVGRASAQNQQLTFKLVTHMPDFHWFFLNVAPTGNPEAAFRTGLATARSYKQHCCPIDGLLGKLVALLIRSVVIEMAIKRDRELRRIYLWPEIGSGFRSIFSSGSHPTLGALKRFHSKETRSWKKFWPTWGFSRPNCSSLIKALFGQKQ